MINRDVKDYGCGYSPFFFFGNYHFLSRFYFLSLTFHVQRQMKLNAFRELEIDILYIMTFKRV